MGNESAITRASFLDHFTRRHEEPDAGSSRVGKGRAGWGRFLDAAHEHEDDDNDEDDAKDATGAVSPAAAVREGGQGADDEEHKDDDEDETEHLVLSVFGKSVLVESRAADSNRIESAKFFDPSSGRYRLIEERCL